MKTSGLIFALAAGAVSLASAPRAQAANWVEYYHHQGTDTRFSYDAASVRRDGTYTYVSWYDNKGITPKQTGRKEWLVYDVRINCAQRWIQNIQVHRVDARTGKRITTIDLRKATNNRPQVINPGSNMAERLRARVC